jgi:Ca-activated chloride channel family protein
VLGVTILVVSLARPEAVVGVPRLEGTVLLAFDVSGSMAADDVEPTRLEVAKATALAFVEDQPASVRIGVVVFSDSGFATQVPTDDRAAVTAAIARLEPERSTSLWRGITEALRVIQQAGDLTTTDYYTNETAPDEPDPTPVPAGVYEPAIIVLLTDGENTVRPDPLEAAQVARDRGVRIHTVGIGTAEGTTLEADGFLVHTQLEEGALEGISEGTGGTYYAATDDVSTLGDDVGARFVVRGEPLELTALFAAVGFVLLLLGAMLSLRWLGRAPCRSCGRAFSCCWWPCRCSSPSGSGRSGDRRPACGSRACRSCEPRHRGRPASDATCRSRCP